MKVRIIQSVELKEMPSRLGDMTSEVLKNTKEVQNLAKECAEVAELESQSVFKYQLMKQCLSNLKAEVQALEQEVSDLDSILDGYINILTGDQTPASPTPVQAPAPVQEGKSDADKG